MMRNDTPNALPIVVRYRPDEVEIAGRNDALIHFACLLLRATHSNSVFSDPGVKSPSPYDGFLSKVVVENKPGKVQVTHDRRTLLISGSVEYLKKFAEHIKWFATQDMNETDSVSAHIHLEYHPDHFYLGLGSVPLIMIRET